MGSDPGSLPDVDQKVCGGISGFEKKKKSYLIIKSLKTSAYKV